MDNMCSLTERDFKNNYVPKDIKGSIGITAIFAFISGGSTLLFSAPNKPEAYADVIAFILLGVLVLTIKSRIAALLLFIMYSVASILAIKASIESGSLGFHSMYMRLLLFGIYGNGIRETIKYHKLRKRYFLGELTKEEQVNLKQEKKSASNVRAISSYINEVKDE